MKEVYYIRQRRIKDIIWERRRGGNYNGFINKRLVFSIFNVADKYYNLHCHDFGWVKVLSNDRCKNVKEAKIKAKELLLEYIVKTLERYT